VLEGLIVDEDVGGRGRGAGSGEPEWDVDATLEVADTSVVESALFNDPTLDPWALFFTALP